MIRQDTMEQIIRSQQEQIAGLLETNRSLVCRKRSIPTHSERLNPPTIIAKLALKSA